MKHTKLAPCHLEVSSSFVALGCVLFNLRNCYKGQKTNKRKFTIRLDQVFQPRWTTMQCVLSLSNCQVDPVRIWSVEYPELLVAPRKHALCPQLHQLYPQLDEPANKEIHFQALNFKTLFAKTSMIIMKFSDAEIQLKKLP